VCRPLRGLPHHHSLKLEHGNGPVGTAAEHLDGAGQHRHQPWQQLPDGLLFLFGGLFERRVDACERLDVGAAQRLVVGQIGRARIASAGRERLRAAFVEGGTRFRLRRRIVWPPLGIARPCWVDDADFDVRRHLDVVALPPPGDDAQLRALAEERFAAPLDPAHPLWHFTFVTGLAGDRVAMIERVHHALVDGVSGVDLAAILMDLTPERRPPRADLPAAAPAGDGPLLLEELRAAVATPVSAATAAVRALRHPSRIARAAGDLAQGLASVARDGWRAPASSLNVPVGAGRHLAWVRADLKSLKAAGRAHGATVNDVLLAAVGGGLRAMLRGRGELVPPDASLKILVPVSQRPDDQRGALGNQVAAMLFGLPVGVVDAADRLRDVHAETVRLKASREPEASNRLLDAANLVPPAALGWVAWALVNQPLVNVIVTNVPGTPFPLYMLGARMLEAYPYVPVALRLAVNVAILSYDGECYLGITADPVACPDADVLAAGIGTELAALGVVPSAAVAAS